MKANGLDDKYSTVALSKEEAFNIVNSRYTKIVTTDDFDGKHKIETSLGKSIVMKWLE